MLKKLSVLCLSIMIIGILTQTGLAAAKVDLLALLQRAVPTANKFTENKSWSAQLPANTKVQEVQGVYNAYNGDKQVAVVVRTAGQGYEGLIHSLVVLDMEGTINKVVVFQHNETPSYVVPINNGSFQKQFEGITLKDKMTLLVGQVARRRGEIQAITNGTSSSKPIAIGVSEARKVFAAIYQK